MARERLRAFAADARRGHADVADDPCRRTLDAVERSVRSGHRARVGRFDVRVVLVAVAGRLRVLVVAAKQLVLDGQAAARAVEGLEGRAGRIGVIHDRESRRVPPARHVDRIDHRRKVTAAQVRGDRCRDVVEVLLHVGRADAAAATTAAATGVRYRSAAGVRMVVVIGARCERQEDEQNFPHRRTSAYCVRAISGPPPRNASSAQDRGHRCGRRTCALSAAAPRMATS